MAAFFFFGVVHGSILQAPTHDLSEPFNTLHQKFLGLTLLMKSVPHFINWQLTQIIFYLLYQEKLKISDPSSGQNVLIPTRNGTDPRGLVQ